ncbi:MAG: HAD family hydrolase [Chloroflexota bacterium]
MESGFHPLIPDCATTILFDLDGTLRENQPSSTEAFIDYAAALGAEASSAQRNALRRWTHYYWAQSPELLQDVAAFKGSDSAFWTNYGRRSLLMLGCDAAQSDRLAPQINEYMEVEHRPVNYVAPDVPVTLAALKAAGLRLGVLSNRTHPCQNELSELGLLEYFDLVLVAAEVLVWKPDPQIFKAALERIQGRPEETLYVGDNYYADILGAEAAGLHPVLIDPQGLFPEANCPVIRTIGELAPDGR